MIQPGLLSYLWAGEIQCQVYPPTLTCYLPAIGHALFNLLFNNALFFKNILICIRAKAGAPGFQMRALLTGFSLVLSTLTIFLLLRCILNYAIQKALVKETPVICDSVLSTGYGANLALKQPFLTP